jgi:Protein of unknown function (DUF3634)
MPDWRILLFVLAVALAWRLVTQSGVLSKPIAVFVVRVRDGMPEAIRGKVTPAFLATVRQVCRECGVSEGEVRGVARGRDIALWFSTEFPTGSRQRLRNWWGFAGWKSKS